ncbi:MAG: amino acid adenylation domain-containing protein [Atopobiaceae bacterium]|nr:amino acid adenylation domain-containing protein [Atopobiaceae bacterium]
MYNILQMLEATAERVPEKCAMADPSTCLTFSELRDAAQSAGTWLIREGVRPRTAVAFYLEKSCRAWASMLGAVYAGGFYSVIDVRQPVGRVRDMYAALEPSVILTDAENATRAHELFDACDCTVAMVEDVIDGEVDTALLDAVRRQATDIDPLYVNFTSGSTGTPKGFVAPHRSVLDWAQVFTSTFGIDETDVMGNQAPFDFDATNKDVYSSLLTGATVQVIPRSYFSNPTQLMDYLCERKVTTLCWAVSAMCFVSIMGGFDYRVPTTVRRVLFSGEVMPPKQLRVWQRHLPEALYVNLYGPSEVTCNCTYHVVKRAYADDEVIPAGKAFANERVFLLDEHDCEVSGAGATGEVCVSGSCLVMGYLGAHDRTAKAFMQNPTNTRWLEPMYRTGDLARYDENGDLVYVSRKDHQIKHLGQRIELGDIEAAAHAVDGVERACCLYDAARKRLVLCYVGSVERKELKELLRERLPQYMVPNNTRKLDEMPLSKNGKIDRAALAELARIRR